MNENWTELVRDLQFYEDIDDHIMYLRRRLVQGAAESMAGRKGSKRNDKLLLEYSNSEWEYIWSTMLEDGAWAVPSIKDSKGNTIKANFAPEILIKFIAHELKTHIIVFDLLLNRVQFLSGNHVKDNNVIFDSPLLIYATGGHFQSLLPKDHEYFVSYANQLEAEHDISDSELPPRSPMGQSHQNPPNNAESVSTIPPSKEKRCEKNEKNYKQKKTSNTNTEKQGITKPNMSKSRHQKVVADTCLIKENRFSCNTVEQEFVKTIESTHSIISSNIGMESEVKVIKS